MFCDNLEGDGDKMGGGSGGGDLCIPVADWS